MLRKQREAIQRPAELGRGPIVRGLAAAAGAEAPAIDREGGVFTAGLIRGFAVITVGEALGHGLWIDAEFCRQVAAAMNADANGHKSRFTHPGLSSDGMGKYLGRATQASIDGDVVRGDLHLAKSAHAAPDGDLAEYVMGLAEEDPAAFGSSIVFEHDYEAEDEFYNAHLVEVEETDYRGQPMKRMRFRSPDPANEQNYPHARLASLRAIDIVDDPAANPEGLFRRGDQIADDAESLLSFALGLTEEAPESSSFDVHPQRVQSFVAKFLERHGLTLAAKDAPMTNPAPTAPAPAAPPAGPTREQFAAELNKFVSRFGEKGAKWFSEGKDYTAALEAHADELKDQLAKKDDEIKTLNEKLAAVPRGEPEPLSSGGEGNAGKDKKPTGLSSLVKMPGK